MPPLPLATFGRSLRRVKPTLAFGLGFMCSLAYFVWGNIESYRKMYKGGCSDCFVFFGYPFKLYQTGGFAGPTAFLWGGLIADVAIVTIVSVSVGWLLKILTRKIAHEPDAV
ncbi:MAG TPA: hypothetical protein VJ843_00385 [Candidatus Saccharimonadales bacterium]|nr:hypothetical protein [Candidatus Saccharimonadales bacterium]